MELAFIVYLIGVIPQIAVLLSMVAFFCGIIAFGYFVGQGAPHKFSLILCILCAVPATLLPSEKAMYTMVGAYAVQKVGENPDVQRLQGKVLKLIEVKLDEYTKEAENVVQSEK